MFQICQEIVKSKETISFKAACSKIGASLRDDFSEIDSCQNDSERDALPANVSFFYNQNSFVGIEKSNIGNLPVGSIA